MQLLLKGGRLIDPPTGRDATADLLLVDGRIVCPWHAWEFRVEDGAFDYNDQIRLRRYQVEVQDGAVLVEIP